MPEQQKKKTKTPQTNNVQLLCMCLFFHIGQNEEPECFIEKYLVVVSLIGKYLNVKRHFRCISSEAVAPIHLVLKH